jgi:hypothetical protein
VSLSNIEQVNESCERDKKPIGYRLVFGWYDFLAIGIGRDVGRK